MLGANCDRLAEPERIRFQDARLAGAPFALIGEQDRGLARFAHEIGEAAIDRRRARARIDEKKHRISLRYRRRGLRLHSCGEALILGVFEPGSIDHPEGKIAELAFAFPPIAGHARLVVDQRETAPDESIE